MLIDVVTEVHYRNAQTAESVRRRLDASGTVAVNVLGSPGAGKTTIIEAIARRVGAGRIAVIEGDLASSVDTERLLAAGVPAVQVNTGGDCHLDAAMVAACLDRVDLAAAALVLVENVGNLVCPADVAIGAHRTIVLASVPEGDDKPLKYPGIFAAADLVVVTKTDVMHAFDFDLERFARRLRAVNPAASVIPASARTGDGMASVVEWLLGALAR